MAFKKVDYGIVNFGQYKGLKKWSEIPKHYLEYIISEECLTPEANKEIAKQELKQRDILDGQEVLF